jgi:predicted CoA-binding protein
MAYLMLDDNRMRAVLAEARVIAVVGHSDKPTRTSYQIARYLRRAGYRVYAVNPTVQQIDGQPSYPSLAAVPEPIDIVNVFRRSMYLMGVVEEAIAVGAGAIWAQLGVYDAAVGEKAAAAGLDVVMNACIKVEHGRLGIG